MTPAEQIESLRCSGADQIDPVHFHFMATLAARASRQEGAVRSILNEKLAHALAAYQERLASATDGDDAVTATPPTVRSPLAELTRALSQQAPTDTDGDAPLDSRAELKSLHYFRDTLSQLSVERQVAQAIAQEPENAGPLNSHLLVLRSLARMRELAPAYLKRFMSYADTLLWLDQLENNNPAPAKKPAPGRKRAAPART